jgi:hypothetical protein
MPGLTLCPVCGAPLVVQDGGQFGKHRDRRWDLELGVGKCPASGQTLLEAVASLQSRAPITARSRERAT